MRCEFEGCDARRSTATYCSKHEARLRRHGDPSVAIPHQERNFPVREDHPNWNDTPSKRTVHLRLRKWFGPAKSHPCSNGCGNQAAHWAFVGPRRSGEREPYSANLDLYVPMCVRCHKRFDLSWIRAVDPPTDIG